MQFLLDLITNPFLVTGITSWMIAQVIKVIIYAIINKSFDIRRLFGDGGMPSGHSATVVSLATFSALTFGPASFEFAVTAILALIVCHDASGVRQEAGKHAVLLDELISLFEEISAEPLPEVRLKKFVGHTNMQVFAGGAIGICNALLMYFLIFR